MCLAIPGKVLTIDRSAQPAMGNVSFSGIEKTVCLEWLPEIQVGDYVLVHVGFAISRLDEQEALETLRLFDDIEAVKEELNSEQPMMKTGQLHPHPAA
jgi:hydrogenase expression/formation protein HypC